MNLLISILALIAFIVVTIDVWRAPATNGVKIGWTVAAFLFSIITLIVWYAWGRNRVYTATTPVLI